MVDVTEPSTPAYAFVIPNKGLASSLHSDRVPPPKNAPLPAFDYCREYEYSLSSTSNQRPEEVVDNPSDSNYKRASPKMVVARFSQERIISAEQLTETWPRYFGRRRSVTMPSDTSAPTLTALNGPDAIPHRPTRNLPNLEVSETVRQSVNEAIYSPDVQNLLQMEWTPELKENVQAILSSIPSIPDAALPLLTRSFGLPTEVVQSLDLSPYALQGKQATLIIRAFSSTLESLNISCNSWVGRMAIRSLSVVAPKLRRIVVLGCDGVRTSELDSMEQDGIFRSYDAVLHSALQLRSLDMPQVGSAEFSAVVRVRSWDVKMGDMRGVSLPTLSRFTVIRGIYDLLRAFTAPPLAQYAIINSNLFLSSCFAHYPPIGTDPASSKALPISTLAGEYFNGNTTNGWIFVLDAVVQPGIQWFKADWAFLHVTEGSYEAHSLRSFVDKLDGPVDAGLVDEIDEILKGKRYAMMQEAAAEMFMSFLDESYIGRNKTVKRRRVF